MKYWLTTQWPYRDDQPNREPRTGVFVQEDKVHVMRYMAPGDKVLVYETVSGPLVINNDTGRQVPCRRGRAGIIAILEIIGEREDATGPFHNEYADGKTRFWKHMAPAKILDSKGFVPLPSVLKALNYKPGGNLRGFGDDHSGLKQIDKTAFDELSLEFKKNPERFA